MTFSIKKDRQYDVFSAAAWLEDLKTFFAISWPNKLDK